jgi:hypothetical protein
MCANTGAVEDSHCKSNASSYANALQPERTTHGTAHERVAYNYSYQGADCCSYGNPDHHALQHRQYRVYVHRSGTGLHGAD